MSARSRLALVLTTMSRLWNGSWADDSVRYDEVNRVAYEPSRVRKIEHEGECV
jgi:hypothetical protein